MTGLDGSHWFGCDGIFLPSCKDDCWLMFTVFPMLGKQAIVYHKAFEEA